MVVCDYVWLCNTIFGFHRMPGSILSPISGPQPGVRGCFTSFLGVGGWGLQVIDLDCGTLYLFGVDRELDVEKRGVGPSPSALRLFDLHSA